MKSTGVSSVTSMAFVVVKLGRWVSGAWLLTTSTSVVEGLNTVLLPCVVIGLASEMRCTFVVTSRAGVVSVRKATVVVP